MAVSNETKKNIWTYIQNKLNNEYGTAGLMGNLYAESGLNSKNLQDTYAKKLGMTDSQYTSEVDKGLYDNFITDKAGYDLLEYSIKYNSSIGSLKMQLNFLFKELSELFPAVLKGLKTAKSIEEASNLVLLEFEKPADQSQSTKDKRIKYSQDFYNEFSENKSGIIKQAAPAKEEPLNIINNFGTTNTTYKADRKLEYIVIHYVAGSTSKPGTALNLSNSCKSGGLLSSAEFYVDDDTIVQYIEDISNRYSWSVGGNKYGSMSTSLGGKFYGKCTNQNSINIEICNEKTNKKSFLATDTDWYFTDAAIDNAVKLTKYLMDKYHIDIDHVIMHHHVTGKLCLPYDNTELLTPSGWVSLEQINIGDTVVQYNKAKNCLEYGQVNGVVSPYEDTVYKLRGFEATSDHRSLTRGAYKNATWNLHSWIQDYNAKQRIFMTNGVMSSYLGLPLSNEEIQLLVWIQGDGHYMKTPSGAIIGVEFYLKKKRKILRIKEILENLDYKYKEDWYENGTVHLRIYSIDMYIFAEQWLPNKIFTYKLLDMTMEQFNVFWNEIIQVDGSTKNNSYFSSIQQNYDVVQAVCATHGQRTLQTTAGTSTCLIATQASLNSTPKSIREQRVTTVGCISVPSSFILVRQSGQTFITGNCPNPWTKDESCLSGWYDFLSRVKGTKVEAPVTKTPKIIESKQVTPHFESYLIKVTANALNVRQGASMEYKVNTIIKKNDVYTIVEEKNGWGKLKSGAGWINLKYTMKV